MTTECQFKQRGPMKKKVSYDKTAMQEFLFQEGLMITNRLK